MVEPGVAGTVCHMGGRVDFTLTFDSSPIKGEGYWLVLSCSPASPCHPSGLRIKSAMTVCGGCRIGTMRCIVLWMLGQVRYDGVSYLVLG